MLTMLQVAEGAELRFHEEDRVYRKNKGVSQSELKEVLRSPAHWLARYGPNAEPTFPSTAMIIGTALHAKVLEPEAFDRQFCDRSKLDKDLTMAELRAALKDEGIEFKSTAKKPELEALLYPDGKPVDKRKSLSGDDFAAVCGMADALRTHDVTGRWFDPGRRNYRRANEVSLYVDDVQGLPIKGRLDRLEKTSEGWMILDLKSTDDASAEAFQKKSFSMGYHVQAAFYIDLVARVMQVPAESVEFMFCAVERKKPHGINVFKASPDLVEFGRSRYKEALATLAYCLKADQFPGFSSDVKDLNLPGWVKKGQATSLF